MTEDEAFERALGKLVSHRNHFHGSEEYAELLLALFHKARTANATDEQLLVHLNYIVNQIIDGCVRAFSTAARNGMQQASELMSSPKHNELLRKRREREMVRQKEYDERFKAERKARREQKIFQAADGKPVQ